MMSATRSGSLSSRCAAIFCAQQTADSKRSAAALGLAAPRCAARRVGSATRLAGDAAVVRHRVARQLPALAQKRAVLRSGGGREGTASAAAPTAARSAYPAHQHDGREGHAQPGVRQQAREAEARADWPRHAARGGFFR